MPRVAQKLVLLAGCIALLGTAVLLQAGSGNEAEPAPIAHWRMAVANVQGKQLFDTSRAFPATIAGKTEFVASPACATFGGGKSGLIVQPKCPESAAFLPKEALSISACVRIDRPTQWGGILSLVQDNGDYERGFILGYSESEFYFGVTGKAKARITYLKSKTPYQLGGWYHVAGTYDGTTMRIYVNGQETNRSDEQSGPIIYAPHQPFVLGRYQDDDELHAMDGAIHEVRLYAATLSADAVRKQYDANAALAKLPIDHPLRFDIQPYLQHVTQTGICITWETSQPATTLVECGPTLATMTARVQEDAPKALHRVTLANLKPQTQYLYRCTSVHADGRKVVSPVRSFLTAVRDDSAYTFAVVGDTQNNGPMTGKIARLMYERRPHFVVHCGDIVEVGAERWRWMDETFGPCATLLGHTAIFPTIGNHEKNHPNYYAYFGGMPQPIYYYRYRYGNADFFSVDSNKPLDPKSEQYQWLDRELAKSSATWKFVYHHHPCWSSDADDYGKFDEGDTTLGDANVRHLATLADKHKVDVVFNGHVHLYERTWPIRAGKVERKNGTIYVTTGGGGGSLEPTGPVPTWFKNQCRVDHHYLYVTIDGNCLQYKAFDQEDRLFDQFELDKDRK